MNNNQMAKHTILCFIFHWWQNQYSNPNLKKAAAATTTEKLTIFLIFELNLELYVRCESRLDIHFILIKAEDETKTISPCTEQRIKEKEDGEEKD